MRDGAYVTDPVVSDSRAIYTPGISERVSSASKFYHTDRLGSTERLTNSSQSTTDTRQYDAFGMLVSSTGSTASPFGFAGEHGYQEDLDSELKLLGHRYYDPSTGRFLTRDPDQDGRNWYTYVKNNPLTFVDPDGQAAIALGLYAVPGLGQVLLAGTIIVGGALLITKGAEYLSDRIAEARRSKGKENRGGKEHKGGTKNWDKHSGRRSGRPNEKKKLKPDWNKKKQKGKPTQNPGGPDVPPTNGWYDSDLKKWH